MLLYSIIFLFGLTIGSFLNAAIYRLGTGESVINARSHCPKCGHILAWHELVPVISFILQKGRCRECGKTISWQYPIVEIATSLLFLLIFNFQFSIFNEFSSSNFQFLNLAYFAIITCGLVIIFVFDLKHYIIPDKIIYPLTGLVFFYRIFEFLEFNNWNLFGNWKLLAPRSFSEGGEIENLELLLNPLYSAVLAFSFFALIYFFSKGRWMGFGDAKLAFFMGLFLGWPKILVALFIAFILGGIIGIMLIIARKKSLKSQVPFGPFLIAGTFISFFWGDQIVTWYLGLIS